MITRRQTFFLASGAALVAMLPTGLAAAPVPQKIAAELYDTANAPIIGNPQGTLTLVEFTDYNCSFCRRAAKDVQALVKANPNLRVIVREWPVFGMGSFFAARAALAANAQGAYTKFHTTMMANRQRADEASVMRVARQIGLDVDRMVRDMDAPTVKDHLLKTERLANALDLAGTPSFAAGNRVEFGAIGIDELGKMLTASTAR